MSRGQDPIFLLSVLSVLSGFGFNEIILKRLSDSEIQDALSSVFCSEPFPGEDVENSGQVNQQ